MKMKRYKLLLIVLLIVGCENSTAPQQEDCAGVAGGTAIIDCKGICGGSALSCDEDVSNSFNFSQSSQQAFYFFNNVTINGTPISSQDYVGAFKGAVCVGSRKWDINICNQLDAH